MHADVELVGVVTAPARPAGRKQQLTATPIQRRRRALDVPAILTPTRLRDRRESLGDRPRPRGRRSCVLADYGQIVPRVAARPSSWGAQSAPVPAAAPPRRDAYPCRDPRRRRRDRRHAHAHGSRASTPARWSPRFARPSTAPRRRRPLEARLAIAAGALLAASLGAVAARRDRARAPADRGRQLTRPLRREDGRLDPSMPAVELERQVRAYLPWPGSFVDTEASGRLIVEGATVAVRTSPAMCPASRRRRRRPRADDRGRATPPDPRSGRQAARR